MLYRREGKTAWKPLKRGLTDAILVWDTTSVPNGRYVVQIAVSDMPSNAPGSALTASSESTTFDIDNVPPVITVTGVRRQDTGTLVTFDVRDADSAVQKTEYSLDGDRWHAIYPMDGIADYAASNSNCGSRGMRPRGRSLFARPTLSITLRTRGARRPPWLSLASRRGDVSAFWRREQRQNA